MSGIFGSMYSDGFVPPSSSSSTGIPSYVGTPVYTEKKKVDIGQVFGAIGGGLAGIGGALGAINDETEETIADWTPWIVGGLVVVLVIVATSKKR